MSKNGVKVLDLFAGCGGLSFGFTEIGFDIIGGIDFDLDSSKTFVKNHQNSKFLLSDIKEITRKDLLSFCGEKKVDVLIGGPPCQGFSLSGKRLETDPRNKLFEEYFRILDILKPKVALLENVPGMMHLFEGQFFKKIITEFELRGYVCNHSILFASDYGVPQSRKRLLIIANKFSKEFIFPKPLEKRVSLGDAISDLPFVDDIPYDKYCSKPTNEFQELMRKNVGKIVHNNERTNHSLQTISIIKLVPEGKNYKSLPKNLQNTRKVNIAWTRLDRNKPSLTIDTGHRHHFHPVANRVPTVRECARIQSFPDRFIFVGSKTSQYRQVGNAVPPLLAKTLALAIKNQFFGYN